MATTVGTLKDDILKLSIELGFPTPPCCEMEFNDVKVLKETLANLKRIAKQKKDALREDKKIGKNIRDFFVKLQRLYKTDCYIYNGKYLLPGPDTQRSLPGEYLLEVGEEYVEMLRTIYPTKGNEQLLCIDSLDEAKKTMDMEGNSDTKIQSLYTLTRTELQDTEEGKAIIQKIKSILSYLETDRDGFISIPYPTNPEVFTLKKIFPLHYENCPDVDISLEFLPTVTEENIEAVEYVCKAMPDVGGNVPLYFIRLHIPYNYFDIYVKYHYF